MKSAILYIHGKNGVAAESEHYKPLFPEHDVVGLDYKSFTPWGSGIEIHNAVKLWAVSLELLSTKEAVSSYRRHGFEERPPWSYSVLQHSRSKSAIVLMNKTTIGERSA